MQKGAGRYICVIRLWSSRGSSSTSSLVHTIHMSWKFLEIQSQSMKRQTFFDNRKIEKFITIQSTSIYKPEYSADTADRTGSWKVEMSCRHSHSFDDYDLAGWQQAEVWIDLLTISNLFSFVADVFGECSETFVLFVVWTDVTQFRNELTWINFLLSAFK